MGFTAWNVPVFGVFLVRIFPHLAKYGEILYISPYLVRMWENMDQKNSEYGHFLRSDFVKYFYEKPGNDVGLWFLMLSRTLVWDYLPAEIQTEISRNTGFCPVISHMFTEYRNNQVKPWIFIFNPFKWLYRPDSTSCVPECLTQWIIVRILILTSL